MKNPLDALDKALDNNEPWAIVVGAILLLGMVFAFAILVLGVGPK